MNVGYWQLMFTTAFKGIAALYGVAALCGVLPVSCCLQATCRPGYSGNVTSTCQGGAWQPVQGSCTPNREQLCWLTCTGLFECALHSLQTLQPPQHKAAEKRFVVAPVSLHEGMCDQHACHAQRLPDRESLSQVLFSNVHSTYSKTHVRSSQQPTAATACMRYQVLLSVISILVHAQQADEVMQSPPGYIHAPAQPPPPPYSCSRHC